MRESRVMACILLSVCCHALILEINQLTIDLHMKLFIRICKCATFLNFVVSFWENMK